MKYFIYIFFPILTLLSIIIFNIKKIHISFDYNIKSNNDYSESIFQISKKRYLSDKFNEDKDKNKNKNNNKTLNETIASYEKMIKYFKELETKFKEQLFEGIVNYTNLTDNNISQITKEGIMKMRIFLPNDKNNIFEENYPIFKIKILENKTLDNWIAISILNNNTKFGFYDKMERKDKNITIHFYNDSFINISYNSILEKSHYFTIPYFKEFCFFQYNIYFIYNLSNISANNITNDEKEIIGLEGSLYSNNCNITMDFNLKKHSVAINEIKSKILIYSIIISCLSLFHLINTKLFINKIDLSMVNCNSICIFTICQNIIWNCYSCYNHFFLLLINIEFKLYFSIVCSLYFINFGLIEFPLLYQLLSLKYSHLINDVLSYRKKIIQFCFIFYVTILFSFIFVMRCYYSPPFILFSFILVWLPQIIFNIYYKNRVSFPIIYIIGVVLNRIFPSFYFNSYENNFLRIPNNKKIVIISILIIVILTLILYSQTLFGPIWFLPKSEEDEYNFYIDEKDLRKIKKDIDNLECLICLNPIIESKLDNNDNNSNNYDNYGGFNETDNLVIEVNDNNLNYLEKNNNKCFKICKFKYKNRCCGAQSIFINFHEYSKNIMNKPFMITPCKHVFHSDCLEEWFKMKKECPNCRTIITQDMYN